MTPNELILQTDIASLKVIHWPDPRLREKSRPLARVDDDVRALADKMFELMFTSRGVGLAAPQVGLNVRLFVASPTFDESDRRVYINPKLLAGEGEQTDDEGCLSFPGITCSVKRKLIITVRAIGLDGEEFEETGEELTARVFQHENDHLDGITLIDRMGSLARMSRRRALKELEERYAQSQ